MEEYKAYYVVDSNNRYYIVEAKNRFEAYHKAVDFLNKDNPITLCEELKKEELLVYCEA